MRAVPRLLFRWMLIDLADDVYRPWAEFRAVMLWAATNAAVTVLAAQLFGVAGDDWPEFVGAGAVAGLLVPVFLRPSTQAERVGARALERLAAAALLAAFAVILDG